MAIKRLRGSQAVKQRRRRLADHPVCVYCDREGITKATEELDHIIPLSQGGSDDDDNIQGLCKFHHRIKSATEDSSHEAASNHPVWLEPSSIPITIVCGPPGSGKTSYVEKRAKAGDVVIDLDAIALEIEPSFDGQWDRALLNQSIRRRNAMLGALQHASSGNAWFIVGAPTARERVWWGKILGAGGAVDPKGAGSEIIYLDVDAATCIKRGADRRKVETYFKAARDRWDPPRPRRKKVGIDADGYPLEGN